MRKTIYSLAAALLATVSCMNLDIPPKDIVTDDNLLSNQAGLSIYLASVYSQMPWEDFKYMASWGFEGNSWLGALGVEGTGESICRDNISTSFTSERTAWWSNSYKLIHSANHLIENIAKYEENFPEVAYNEYLGQGYFIRAYCYTQMARRFGGVPLVMEEISYPLEGEIEVYRSSEKDTWDAILADYDRAVELLPATATFECTANKYVALAFKAEAMLYAGSVAKYNEQVDGRLTGIGSKSNNRVIGFAEDEWRDSSRKYFSEAYKAAKEVIDSGVYSLYKKSWKAGDKEAQYANIRAMWSDLSSPENILVRRYEYPTLSHGIDAYSSPWLWRSPLSAGTCPTADFMELFDGFDRYADGTIRVTDGTDHTNGNYLLYPTPMDFFKDVEPRLRAQVIFPGDVFRGREIEVRMGIYTGTAPIPTLKSDYSFGTRGSGYHNLAIYTTKDNPTLFMDTNEHTKEVQYTGKDGSVVKSWASGECGPFLNNNEATMTGLYLRKYLDENKALADIGEGKSDQPFILMRYADVLLAAAEAAVELSIAGAASPVGDDMLQVATDAVKSIQERAGAVVVGTKLAGDLQSRDIVRKERRKELAFEHKTKWDLRRWRVLDEDNRKGFWGVEKDLSTWSDGSRFSFQGFYPFYSSQEGKWFFDISYQKHMNFSYSVQDYYFAIPSGEVSKSKYIDQQPNR